MKGIILAGGLGTRVYPLTCVVNKHLLPVYDKPMIYYPLSTLMLCGIKDILIISMENDISDYRNLLGDGSRLGINLSYISQKAPNGIAEAFIIGRNFIGNSNVTLILGDNIFYLPDLEFKISKHMRELQSGAVNFATFVNDPERYGVASFDTLGTVIDIEEKPPIPKSNYAVTGLYSYSNDVVELVKEIKPSERGELEITDINKRYLKEKRLKMVKLARGSVWLDCGTHESLIEAGKFIQILEQRQGIKIACLEEVALRRGYISIDELTKLIFGMPSSSYKDYLSNLVSKDIFSEAI